MHRPLQTTTADKHSRASAYTAPQQSTAQAKFPAAHQPPLQLQSNNAPAQLNGGWILSQLWSLASNPYVITAGLISLPVIYWLTQRSKGMKAMPPDELCNLLKVNKDRLVKHLNHEEGGFTEEEAKVIINRFFQNKETKGRSMEPDQLGLVPSVLIDGLHGNDSQKIEMLFNRFNKFPFNYTGNGQPLLEGLLLGHGDCKTLVNMFIAAVHAAGIKDIQYQAYGDDMLVEKRAIHGRDTKGNVYQQKCWFFTDHHWVTCQGQFYDLLFMTKQKPVTSYLTATKEYNGVTYKLFDNNYCFIHDTEVEEKLNFDIGGTMGIVFEGGEGEAIEFINAHIK